MPRVLLGAFAPRVGRAFPGQGDDSYPGTAGTVAPRLVRRVPAAGIRYQLPAGPDVDPPMPALRLPLPWRLPSDAPKRGDALPGGADASSAPKRCCGARR